MTTGMIIEGIIIALMILALYKGYLMFTDKKPMTEEEKQKFLQEGILAAVVLGMLNFLMLLDPKIKDKLGIMEKTVKTEGTVKK